MNGIGNKPGWAWIFILEGLFTFAFGVVSYWLLPRSPANARFLRQEEKDYIAARLQEDGATSKDEAADAFSWREVGMAFTLPQVWLIAIAFFFAGKCLLRGITTSISPSLYSQEPCYMLLPSKRINCQNVGQT